MRELFTPDTEGVLVEVLDQFVEDGIEPLDVATHLLHFDVQIVQVLKEIMDFLVLLVECLLETFFRDWHG